MASYDPSDYDSVYSEEEYMEVVQGASTPPLMNYDEFLAKTMGEYCVAVFPLYFKIKNVYIGYTYILLVQCRAYIPIYLYLCQHTY